MKFHKHVKSVRLPISAISPRCARTPLSSTIGAPAAQGQRNNKEKATKFAHLLFKGDVDKLDFLLKTHGSAMESAAASAAS